MSDIVVEPHGSQMVKTPRKAAVSGWIGSALEYYDFFIYGTAAALIFPRLFFPAENPTTATIASLATFGVAYVARPIGSFIFGHLGDTIGRKRVLTITLFGMGGATFAIGILPTYDQIGIWAPVLLLICRIMQGLAVSGEQSSASSTALEHAPANRRAFYSSFTLAGTQAGNILASLAFLVVATLPDEQLFTWGWRIPFLLSVVVVAVGWWIRKSLHESPVFTEEKEHGEVPKAPLKVLFKVYTGSVLLIVFAALASVNSTIFGQFALTYGVTGQGMSRSMFLWLAILINFLALFTIPVMGLLSDKVGRKPVYVIGMIGVAIMVWPFLWSINQKNVPLLFITSILMVVICYACYAGTAFAIFNEQFSTRVRMSGVAVGTQFGFALGGFAPAIAATLAGEGLQSWVPVAVFACAAALIAAVAAAFMRETYKTPLNDLGKKAPAKSAS
ncbi:MHS family MFS transporter [Arthrobacter sp. Z1-9]